MFEPGQLKLQDRSGGGELAAGVGGERRAQPQRVGRTEDDQAPDQLRVERRRRPADHAAVAGADEIRGAFAERRIRPATSPAIVYPS